MSIQSFNCKWFFLHLRQKSNIGHLVPIIHRFEKKLDQIKLKKIHLKPFLIKRNGKIFFFEGTEKDKIDYLDQDLSFEEMDPSKKILLWQSFILF